MSNIRRMGYLLAAILGMTALSSLLWKPAVSARFSGITSQQVPFTIGSYTGVDVPVDAVTRGALPTATIIQRRFTGADGSQINVTVIGGTGRNELHDPRSCLLGAGWRIVGDHVEQLPDFKEPILARSCLAELSDRQSTGFDILYLYVVDRRIIASASAIRWTLLKSDLLDQSDQPVYFLRVLSPLPSLQEGPQARIAEHAQLTQFTSLLWRNLSPVILEGERS